MAKPTIRFTSFPRTEPPPAFVGSLVGVFRSHEQEVSTTKLTKGLTSNQVLCVLEPDLVELGFAVERGKSRGSTIERPVFFGEDGVPSLRYQVDAYHDAWRCGLEVEAGRALGGNAVYRDLIQAMLMVGVDHLCLAVPNLYVYKSAKTKDYESTVAIAEALFGHDRVRVPYGLTVIGY